MPSRVVSARLGGFRKSLSLRATGLTYKPSMSLNVSSRTQLGRAAQSLRSAGRQTAAGLRVRSSGKLEEARPQAVSSNGATSSVNEASQNNGAGRALNVVERVPADAPNPRLHIIRKSRWPKGIPAVMGAHLMASGNVAPLSTSKGMRTASWEPDLRCLGHARNTGNQSHVQRDNFCPFIPGPAEIEYDPSDLRLFTVERDTAVGHVVILLLIWGNVARSGSGIFESCLQ